MTKHKYHSLLLFHLAGILLAVFSPRRMRCYYPSCFCAPYSETVEYYCFSRHNWIKDGAK
jgi:hypothetical protein